MNNIQDYYQNWFQVSTPASISAATNTSQVQIRLYPDHVYGYNNLGTAQAIGGKYDDALVTFKRAEMLSPKDTIVLSNIARCYEMLKDNSKAKDYYKKIVQFGSKDEIEFAKERISKL